MGRRLTVALSDETFTIIQRQATEANISPSEVASVSLERYFHGPYSTNRKARGHSKRVKAESQLARERFERHFGAIDLGYATGISNEEIDADLGREYANLHEKA